MGDVRLFRYRVTAALVAVPALIAFGATSPVSAQTTGNSIVDYPGSGAVTSTIPADAGATSTTTPTGASGTAQTTTTNPTGASAPHSLGREVSKENGLAITGTDVIGFVVIAGGLVAIGVASLAARRRARNN